MTRSHLSLAFALCLSLQAYALEVPKLAARITDLAGLLSSEEAAVLESRLRDLEATDSTQVAVLIIPSLEGEVLEEYSEKVATAWGLGQKGRDNGALLLIALKERRMRIEVGYGLESRLTDARSRRIIGDEIAPRFREGNFYRGIEAGVAAIIQTVRGEYQEASPHQTGGGSRWQPALGNMSWVVVIALSWILGKMRTLGRLFFGGGTGMLFAYLFMGGGVWPLVLGAMGGALLGVAFGALLSKGGGPPSGLRYGGTSGGSFTYTGGGFSGGSSGGGFSGGGGRFGGGGSSGSW